MLTARLKPGPFKTKSTPRLLPQPVRVSLRSKLIQRHQDVTSVHGQSVFTAIRLSVELMVDGSEQRQADLAHGGSSPAPRHTSVQVVRRRYGGLVREVLGKIDRCKLGVIYAAEESSQMTSHGHQRHGQDLQPPPIDGRPVARPAFQPPVHPPNRRDQD